MIKKNSKVNKKKSKRPTLLQVAKLAKVQVSTASEILNNKKNSWASEATRKRVFDAATKLQYRPNLAARSLRVGSTFTIGLVTVGLNVGAKSGRIYGLYDAAIAQGYNLMISFNPNDPEQEEQLIRHQMDRGIDALVVYPAENGNHNEIRKLVQSGFPVVTYDGSYIMDFKCDDICPDYPRVGQIQLEHLLDIGKTRIALANTIPYAFINQCKDERIIELLEQKGMNSCLYMNIKQEKDKEIPDWEGLYTQILEFVRNNKGKFDAVIAYDSLASLTIRALLEEKIKIPEEVAVMGGGNSMLATHGAFPISSVDTDDYWLGEEAFKLLRERMNNKIPPQTFRKIISVPVLKVRSSTDLHSLKSII